MHKGQPTSAAFLFLFLLTHACQACRLGTVDECKAARLVPGHSFIGRGFDITTMEMTQHSVLDMNHKYPNGTCLLCENTYESKEEDKLQAIGLNIHIWGKTQKTSSCKFDIASSSHSSVISIAIVHENAVPKSWYDEAKIPNPKNFGNIVFTGSHSKLVRDVRGEGVKSNNVYFLHNIYCTFYSIELQSNLTVLGHFQNMMNNLPTNYNCSTKDDYFKVIKFYGTHYVSGGNWGGRARVVTSVEQCSMSLSGLTTDEIRNCLAKVYSGPTFGWRRIHRPGFADHVFAQHPKPQIKTCGTAQEQIEFNERSVLLKMKKLIYIDGGDRNIGLQAVNGRSEIADWIKTIPGKPAVISNYLTAIHEFLPPNSPQRLNFQKAVSDYMNQRTLKVSCLNSCSGSVPQNDCHCVCTTTAYRYRNCCPKHKYTAILTVQIKCAKNLYGDWWGYTDAYVKVEFQGLAQETDVVWDNNNPCFNKEMQFFNISLLKMTIELTITVYDNDQPLKNDLLGSCTIQVSTGSIQDKTCVLNHGHLEYRFKVACMDALEGVHCENVIPQTPTFSSQLSG